MQSHLHALALLDAVPVAALVLWRFGRRRPPPRRLVGGTCFVVLAALVALVALVAFPS